MQQSLYKLFCQVTGYGGTPKIVEMNSSNTLSQEIKVRFDSTIEKNSIVTFEPEIKTMKIKIGENSLAFLEHIIVQIRM